MNIKTLPRGKRGITALEIVGYIFLIAIIAGLVVPPVQRAVAREWAGQIEALVTDTVDAQKQYFAANKKYSVRFDALKLQIESPSRPPVSDLGLVVSSEDSNRTFPHYEILLNTLPPAQFESVTGALLSGHYRGAGLTYVFRDLKDGHISVGKLLCFEIDDYRFAARPGGFCEDVLGYKYIYTSKFWMGRFYEKPEPVKPAQAVQQPVPQPAAPAVNEPAKPAPPAPVKPAPKKTVKKVTNKR